VSKEPTLGGIVVLGAPPVRLERTRSLENARSASSARAAICSLDESAAFETVLIQSGGKSRSASSWKDGMILGLAEHVG
jgi:hypothetical protein